MRHLLVQTVNLVKLSRTLKFALALVMPALLAGCLVMEGKAFDETNSVPASDSPLFERIRTFGGEADEGLTKFAEEGGRVMEVGGLVVMEINSEDASGFAEPLHAYGAIGIFEGRAISCVPRVSTTLDLAAEMGIEPKEHEGEGDATSNNPSERLLVYVFTGPPAARGAFVKAAYGEGDLECRIHKREAE